MLIGPSGASYLGEADPESGKVLGVEEGQAAARACGVSIINTLMSATENDRGKVKKIVKIEGFVNSTNDFTSQPQVINGEMKYY